MQIFTICSVKILLIWVYVDVLKLHVVSCLRLVFNADIFFHSETCFVLPPLSIPLSKILRQWRRNRNYCPASLFRPSKWLLHVIFNWRHTSFCCSFYDAVNILTTESQVVDWLMNELERIWKDAVVAGTCLERLKEIKKILSQNSRCTGRYSNRTPPDYKSKAVFLKLWPTEHW
jgi:hypothetical protein